MAKSVSIISCVRDAAQREMVFTVKGAGLSPEAPDEHLTLRLDAIAQTNLDRAVMHGLEQRVRDKGALGWNDETKRYATPREKWLAMRSIVEHLNSGSVDWELKVRQRSESSLLAEAMALAFPSKTAEQIAARIASWSAAEQRKALLLPEIKAAADIIRSRDADPEAAAELLEGF